MSPYGLMTPKRTRWVAVLVINTGLLLSFSSFAEEARVVGHIVDMRGAGSDYGIERITARGRDCPPAPATIRYFTPICTSDQLLINASRGELKIRFNGSDRLISVHQRNAPYEIDISPNRRSPLDGLFDQIASMMSSAMHDLLPKDQEALLNDLDLFSRASPGAPLAAPVFERGVEPLLIAGQRPFTLGWTGGEPPFSIELRPDGTELPMHRWTAIDQWHLPPETIELIPSAYRLVIADHAGARIEHSFTVTPEDHLPRWRIKAPFDGDQPSLEQTLYAAWLANTGDQWLWEAAMQALSAGDRFSPATMLGARLLQGMPPRR